MTVKKKPQLQARKSNSHFVGVKGSSVIKHRDRCKLGLNCIQYVCMQYMDQHSTTKDVFNPKSDQHIWEHLGMELDDFMTISNRLESKGLIEKSEKGWKISNAWRNENPKEDQLFDEIFSLLREKGNRATARRNFAKCCAKEDPQFILQRAKLYNQFHVSKGTELKFWLKAENFLDPNTERYKDKLEHETKSTTSAYSGKLGKIRS